MHISKWTYSGFRARRSTLESLVQHRTLSRPQGAPLRPFSLGLYPLPTQHLENIVSGVVFGLRSLLLWLPTQCRFTTLGNTVQIWLFCHTGHLYFKKHQDSTCSGATWLERQNKEAKWACLTRKKKTMVQGEVSQISPETGLSSDLGRQLRRVHFGVVQFSVQKEILNALCCLQTREIWEMTRTGKMASHTF